MNLTFKLALVFFLLLTLSCKEQHLFSDQSELATVTRDFEDKQKALPHGDLFRIFTTSLNGHLRKKPVAFWRAKRTMILGSKATCAFLKI